MYRSRDFMRVKCEFRTRFELFILIFVSSEVTTKCELRVKDEIKSAASEYFEGMSKSVWR